MELRDEFKFYHVDSKNLYTAKRDGFRYLVTWDQEPNANVPYSVASVKRSIINGIWELQPTIRLDKTGLSFDGQLIIARTDNLIISEPDTESITIDLDEYNIDNISVEDNKMTIKVKKKK